MNLDLAIQVQPFRQKRQSSEVCDEEVVQMIAADVMNTTLSILPR
jgi:hypothetical protein